MEGAVAAVLARWYSGRCEVGVSPFRCLNLCKQSLAITLAEFFLLLDHLKNHTSIRRRCRSARKCLQRRSEGDVLSRLPELMIQVLMEFGLGINVFSPSSPINFTYGKTL